MSIVFIELEPTDLHISSSIDDDNTIVDALFLKGSPHYPDCFGLELCRGEKNEESPRVISIEISNKSSSWELLGVTSKSSNVTLSSDMLGISSEDCSLEKKEIFGYMFFIDIDAELGITEKQFCVDVRMPTTQLQNYINCVNSNKYNIKASVAFSGGHTDEPISSDFGGYITKWDLDRIDYVSLRVFRLEFFEKNITIPAKNKVTKELKQIQTQLSSIVENTKRRSWF